MLRNLLRFLLLSICLILVACSHSSSSTTAPSNTGPITVNKDYLILPTPLGTTHIPGSSIKVYEFFSYGCPWCFKFEPFVEKWQATLPADVSFERVPVAFEQGWDVYAKAYYTARDLGVEGKLTPLIFAAIQQQNIDLTDPAKLEQFFVQNGVSQSDFDSTFNFTPGIAAQMMHGDELIKEFGIYEIPTFVIDGKYITSVRMTNGDNARFIQVINYLIDLDRKGTQS